MRPRTATHSCRRLQRRLLVGLISLLLSSLASVQGQANLLANPGFEQLDEKGFAASWDRLPAISPEPGAVSIDPAVSHSGERSLRLHHERTSSYTRAQQVINVEPNARYYFRCWMRGEALTPATPHPQNMGARLYIEGLGGRDYHSERGIGSFGWQQLTIGPFDSGRGGKITVMCYLHQASGTVWYDDLEAIKATPDWEKRQLQERAYRRFTDDLELALTAATQARDEVARAELQRLGESLTVDSLPDHLDYRADPPYFPAHARLFQVMARLNARRLPGQTLAAWVDDPFAPLPVLGLAPQAGPRVASVLMGLGERDQAVINLCNLSNQPLRLRVSVAGLEGTGAPQVTLRKVVPLETRGGGMIADPLPRLRPSSDGAILTLAPGVFRQLWLDLSSAKSTPGVYRAQVKLRGPGRVALDVPLTIEVLRVSLPEKLPIVTWNYSYQNEVLLKDRWEQARADLQAHHINAYCWPGGVLPWPKFDETGALLPLDWSNLDRALQAHEGVQYLLLWPIFEAEGNLKLQQGLTVGSPLWEQRFVAWFRALIAGLKARGFGYDRVAWYLTDEPATDTRVRQTVLAGQAIRQADPQALLFENPTSSTTQPMLERMAPVVDIWAPMLNWVLEDARKEGKLLDFFRTSSRVLWSYQVLGQHTSAFERYRLSFWECWDKGITGQGFWAYASCGGSNWDPYDSQDADYAVVYEGDPEELIPSKRWEAWREGVEDYSYLWLLQQREGQRGTPLLQTEVKQLLAQPSPTALARLREQVLRKLARTEAR